MWNEIYQHTVCCVRKYVMAVDVDGDGGMERDLLIKYIYKRTQKYVSFVLYQCARAATFTIVNT